MSSTLGTGWLEKPIEREALIGQECLMVLPAKGKKIAVKSALGDWEHTVE